MCCQAHPQQTPTPAVNLLNVALSSRPAKLCSKSSCGCSCCFKLCCVTPSLLLFAVVPAGMLLLLSISGPVSCKKCMKAPTWLLQISCRPTSNHQKETQNAFIPNITADHTMQGLQHPVDGDGNGGAVADVLHQQWQVQLLLLLVHLWVSHTLLLYKT